MGTIWVGQGFYKVKLGNSQGIWLFLFFGFSVTDAVGEWLNVDKMTVTGDKIALTGDKLMVTGDKI